MSGAPFRLRPASGLVSAEAELEESLPLDTFLPVHAPLSLAPDPADPLRSPIVLREVAVTSRFDVCEGQLISSPTYVPPPGEVLSVVTAVTFGHADAPERIEFDVTRYRDGAFLGRVCSATLIARQRAAATAGQSNVRHSTLIDPAFAASLVAAFGDPSTPAAAARRTTWSFVNERLTDEGCLRRYESIDGIERVTSIVQVVGRSLVEIPEGEWAAMRAYFEPGEPVQLIDGPPAAMAVGGDPRGLPPRG